MLGLRIKLIEPGATWARDVANKKITMPDFMEKVCTWALEEGFDELTPELEPIKPQAIIDYELMDKDKKSKMSNSFWLNSNISYYLNEYLRVSNKNKANYLWLREIRDNLNKENTDGLERINQRIETFIPALKRTGVFQFKSKDPDPYTSKVLSSFDGKLDE